MQFDEVKFRGVALVLAETIFGKTSAEVPHNRVARDFRDHARGGDAETVAIAVDDGGLREREWEHRQAVDEDMLGLKSEAGEGKPHRLLGRAQDIDRVDLDGIDDADGPGDCVVANQILVNLFAFLGKKLLRIVQLPVPEFFRKNNGCGYDGPRERAAPGFIDARDGGDPERTQFAFMPETTATVHRRENTEMLRN
jgi:hypothetical protein